MRPISVPTFTALTPVEVDQIMRPGPPPTAPAPKAYQARLDYTETVLAILNTELRELARREEHLKHRRRLLWEERVRLRRAIQRNITNGVST